MKIEDRELYESIASLDLGAAMWIEENWDSLKGRNLDSDSLRGLFAWRETILGHKFWSAINARIRRRKGL